MKGVDYSWARPGGAAIKAAGFQFAMRYVPFPGDQGKGLSATELADLQNNGIAVGLVFESTGGLTGIPWELSPGVFLAIGGRALAGSNAGVSDARQCLLTETRLGWPKDRPFYFAIDFDAQAYHMAVVDEYLNGATSVLGAERVGVYGSYAVVEHCYVAKTARWYWQTYAWSAGRVSTITDVWQYLNGQTLNGAAVDYDQAIHPDFGQWPAPEAPVGMSNDDLLAVFGSSENLPDGTPDWPTRLANATYRRDEAAAGRAPSVRDLAADARASIDLHIANSAAGVGPVGNHEHAMGNSGPVIRP